MRRRAQALSLHARLLLIVTALLLIAEVLFCLACTALLRANLRAQVDHELRTQGVAAIETALGRLQRGQGESLLLSDYFIQFSDTSGTVLQVACARTSTGACRAAPRLPVLDAALIEQHQQQASSEIAAGPGDAPGQGAGAVPVGEPVTVPDTAGGEQWRVIYLPATTAAPTGASTGAPVHVAVALPLAGTSTTVATFLTGAVLIGALVLLAGAGAGALVTARALRPLGRIERTASAIAASALATGDLRRRVPGAGSGTEVARLAAALNTMLARIEQLVLALQRSQEQMRRFIADASHELRTPLAAIRGYSELYRQGAVREDEQVAHVMGRIESEAIRLGTLVQDLLALARLDQAQAHQAQVQAQVQENGQQNAQHPDQLNAQQNSRQNEVVDLAVLAADAVHDARALAPQRQVRLVGLAQGAGAAPAPVLGEDAGLRQVLGNLLANALHHTPQGSPVQVAVGTVQGPSGTHSVLEVRDHGPGISEQEAHKVFERFYRSDASRQRATGGSGLGLSIAAAIVAGHGGSIAVVPTPGGGATFRVRLRAHHDPHQHDDGHDDGHDDQHDDGGDGHGHRHEHR
ncbi:sensor histidine kinase [Kineococcus sp. SYSU DK005]|uniref:sensor histidine kinase n=1 Tax=Kineococcus sp. SYSU DK005 TaxID=3383126 RepID=UPI003D7DF5D1